MIALLIWAPLIVVSLGMVYAWRRWHDIFHPLMITGPMFAFLYWYLPLRLHQRAQLFDYFDLAQIATVQFLNVMGVFAFVAGCTICIGNVRKRAFGAYFRSKAAFFAICVGLLGLGCWWLTILNMGGLKASFSASYGGGWSESGYMRDAAYLLFSAILILFFYREPNVRMSYLKYLVIAVFALPWAILGVLGARRGPTFELAVTITLCSYFSRRTRPRTVAVAVGGLVLGYALLFLVTNRSELYLGSDLNLTADVTEFFDAHQGNEYIYGTAVVLNASGNNSFFWGRRYLAYLFIRPIPTLWWPTKYEDMGVPELLHNAGTAGAGITQVFAWREADGAAPGLVGDLWVECWWFAVPAMFLLGWMYGTVWRKGAMLGGIWSAQYVVLASLAAFLVMQTVEAALIRTILISTPLWIAERVVSRRLAVVLEPGPPAASLFRTA